jgi:hypothetical protein
MLEILKNTILFLLWVAASAALVYGIYQVTADANVSGTASVMLWLVGQLLILSPLVRVLWVNRNQGNPT